MSLNINPKGPFKIDPHVLQAVGKTEADAIVAAAKSYIEADVHIAAGSQTYTVLNQEGDFARVGVGVSDGGGYSAILKKVYGIWVVVIKGQDLPGKELSETYGLPVGWFSTEY